jgi:hypothetical protein
LRSSRSFSVSSRSLSFLSDSAMSKKRSPPAKRRRAGSGCYLERALDEEPERLPPERAFAERLEDEPERDEPDPDRDELARDPLELDFARLDEPVRDEPVRDELVREEPEREPLDLARVDEPERDELARDEPERELLDAEPDRELLAREPELREPELRDPLDERLEPFDELRELDDERRRELDLPLRRSAAGISSLATAFASCGICFSRNLAMRSSSRRMPRASLAVSLSFTASASASMPV